MKKLLSILILAISFQTILAVNVEGVVLDSETNLPLADAVILALSNNKVIASAGSNVKGKFKITLKKDELIRLEVVKNGYKTENADININQEFIDAAPFITIKLHARSLEKNQNENKQVLEAETMEDVGNLSDLPKGYKIIEAVPIKEKDEKSSGFNVREEVRDQTTNVNVNVLKTEYNKALETDAVIPNHNFSTSFYKEGAIFYNVGKAYLSADVEEILKGIALRLKADPETSLRLSVFSDANKELKIADFICKMRMEEIVNLLLNEGVAFEQLDVLIYGYQLMQNDCGEGVECSEEQHQENRRVALSFVK